MYTRETLDRIEEEARRREHHYGSAREASLRDHRHTHIMPLPAPRILLCVAPSRARRIDRSGAILLVSGAHITRTPKPLT
jgi:hypothetical protein